MPFSKAPVGSPIITLLKRPVKLVRPLRLFERKSPHNTPFIPLFKLVGTRAIDNANVEKNG